jgi:hypothetical protein
LLVRPTRFIFFEKFRASISETMFVAKIRDLTKSTEYNRMDMSFDYAWLMAFSEKISFVAT